MHYLIKQLISDKSEEASGLRCPPRGVKGTSYECCGTGLLSKVWRAGMLCSDFCVQRILLTGVKE